MVSNLEVDWMLDLHCIKLTNKRFSLSEKLNIQMMRLLNINNVLAKL